MSVNADANVDAKGAIDVAVVLPTVHARVHAHARAVDAVAVVAAVDDHDFARYDDSAFAADAAHADGETGADAADAVGETSSTQGPDQI